LQPDFAGAAEEDEEETFASEEFVFDTGYGLDVVIDGGFEGDEAAGVDAEGLAGGEGVFDDCAASVEEGETAGGGGNFLEDEALATEEASAKLFGEGDVDVDAAGSAEEGVLLAEELATMGGEVDGDDFAGEWGGEGDVGAFRALVGEEGDEEGITGDGTLSGFEEFADEAAALVSFHGELGGHGDAILHVEEGTGFGDAGLAGIEGDDDGLEIVADDAVIDDVWHGEMIPEWRQGGHRAAIAAA